MDSVERSREFTPFEKYYFWRNKLNMYSNFRVAVEYSEELTLDAIHYALHDMVRQHSSLSMNAYEKERYVPFIQFPYVLKFMRNYKLSDVLTVIEDDTMSVTDVFNQLQNVHFEYGSKRPLWSLILLNRKTLVYYSDHLLFDGSSGLNFHRVFSEYLSKYKKNKVSGNMLQFDSNESFLFDIEDTEYKFNIAPKPSDLIDYKVPVFYVLYVIMMICFPKSLLSIIKYYFIDDGNISRSRTYNMISLSKKMIQMNNTTNDGDQCKLVHISQDKLQTLIGDCRKYNVKLTSLLVVMSLLSISKITGDERDTMVVIPVNSRDKIKDESVNKDFGLYLGDLNLELPPVSRMCNNGKINWNFVKYVNDYIHRSRKDSQRDLALTRLIDTKMFLEQRKMCYDNTMIGTLLVSNLGNLKTPKDMGNELDNGIFENAYFDQPCKSGVLSLFAMNVISTQKGGAHLALHSVNPQWLDVFNEGVTFQLSQF